MIPQELDITQIQAAFIERDCQCVPQSIDLQQIQTAFINGDT